jgi:hypothetical protein
VDLFVHFSAIRPLNNTHRTLVKGEYVSFDIGENHGGSQAVMVTGVLGGPLMCDNVDPPGHQTERVFRGAEVDGGRR